MGKKYEKEEQSSGSISEKCTKILHYLRLMLFKNSSKIRITKHVKVTSFLRLKYQMLIVYPKRTTMKNIRHDVAAGGDKYISEPSISVTNVAETKLERK